MHVKKPIFESEYKCKLNSEIQDFLKKVFLKLDFKRTKLINSDNCDLSALDDRVL